MVAAVVTKQALPHNAAAVNVNVNGNGNGIR
jgi:hypothetical protein